MFTKKTSLIIPTRNRANKVIKLINDLAKYSINFNEIIVVDSSDLNQRKKLKSFFFNKKIRLIYSKASTSYQRNLGLKKIKKNSKFVLFLDDDIVIYKNSFKIMNKKINYFNNEKICSFAFNLTSKFEENFIEKYLKNSFLKFLKMYDDTAGKVLENGWHTKISNLNRDTYVQWVYSGATIFKTSIIRNYRFYDLNKGFNYLEDLHFSFNLTKKNFQHIVIAQAKVGNPNFVRRTDYLFGNIEVQNRYKIVCLFNLNKKLFFITILLKFFYLFFQSCLFLRFYNFPRLKGNLIGILKIFKTEIDSFKKNK